MQQTKKSLYLRGAQRLIRCYPACWRQRYGEEMLLTLEDSQPTFKTILNLFVHIFDAYLHQSIVKERTHFMLWKMRSSELSIYGATLIFFVAWFVLQIHFVDFVPGAPRVLFHSISYTPSLLVNIIHTIPWLLTLFTLSGGLPILLAACRQAVRERELFTLLLCLLGLISPLLVAVIFALTFSSLWFFYPFNALICVGLSLALITFAVQRVAPSQRVTHYALSLAAAIPLVMLIGLVILMLKVIPPLFTLFLAGESLFYVLREGLLISLMGGTLVFILVSLKEGFEVRRAMRSALP